MHDALRTEGVKLQVGDIIDRIVSRANIEAATEEVVENRGAAGIDKMSVYEGREYMRKHQDEIVEQIRNGTYMPQPVRRVYIPKPNGKKRGLGIPTVVDRVVQQMISRVLIVEYDQYFSEYSYGFRPKRNAHMAMKQALKYLNEDGCEWVIDLDIEKYFDTVNHDKLISILREHVNDAKLLHLIRSFLKAGVMEKGLVSETVEGVPQGGPLSCVLSNIYLDKFDKELEQRGLRFARYADDCNIFVKSELAANRVMQSVSVWLQRKLFLKVNAEKSKVVRPTNSLFLGFTYWKSKDGWKLRPASDRKKRLQDKIRVLTDTKLARATDLGHTFYIINQTVKGWINYYSISSMKTFMENTGSWLRHRVRRVIITQWKKPRTIMKNLLILNRLGGLGFSTERIRQIANTRLGKWRMTQLSGISRLISEKFLETPNKSRHRPALVNPLEYYLKKST